MMLNTLSHHIQLTKLDNDGQEKLLFPVNTSEDVIIDEEGNTLDIALAEKAVVIEAAVLPTTDIKEYPFIYAVPSEDDEKSLILWRYKNGEWCQYSSAGNGKMVELTKAQYDALAPSEKNKDIIYFISDANTPVEPVVIDSELSDTSENPVQNKVIKAEMDKKVNAEDMAVSNKTFYVNGTSGSDENDGTEATPFKTIQKAIDSFAAINTKKSVCAIYIKNGTYNEIVSIQDKNIELHAIDSNVDITINGLQVVHNAIAEIRFGFTINRQAEHGVFYAYNSVLVIDGNLTVNGTDTVKSAVVGRANSVMNLNGSLTANTAYSGINLANGSSFYSQLITIDDVTYGMNISSASTVSSSNNFICTNCTDIGIVANCAEVRLNKIVSGTTSAINGGKISTGTGDVTNDGTVISENADYAEINKWSDGNPDNEDRIGYFVTVSKTEAGITMSKSTSTSDVRGVTVTAPAFSGGASHDKFDGNGKLLNAYDYVAFAGFVNVIDNGSCSIGGRCMPDDNGCAVPSSNNLGYEVIDRVDENTILVLIEPNGDMIQRIKTDITNIEDGTTVVKKSESAEYSSNSTPNVATLKNIQAGTADLVAGSSPLATGTIYLVYE